MRPLSLFLLGMLFTGFTIYEPVGDVELICMRKHHATETCYYNFRIGDLEYHYIDNGCKFKKRENVIEKAEHGKIALAKRWQYGCFEHIEDRESH